MAIINIQKYLLKINKYMDIPGHQKLSPPPHHEIYAYAFSGKVTRIKIARVTDGCLMVTLGLTFRGIFKVIWRLTFVFQIETPKFDPRFWKSRKFYIRVQFDPWIKVTSTVWRELSNNPNWSSNVLELDIQDQIQDYNLKTPMVLTTLKWVS